MSHQTVYRIHTTGTLTSPAPDDEEESEDERWRRLDEEEASRPASPRPSARIAAFTIAVDTAGTKVVEVIASAHKVEVVKT
jgi:hypothetical protein